MKRYLIITILALFGVYAPALALDNTRTLDILSLRSANQELIERAVRQGLLVAHAYYHIVDTASAQKYGRDGKDYFNQQTALAVRVQDNIVYPQSLLSPWETDSAFSRYKDQYHPVCSRIRFADWNDSTALVLDSAALAGQTTANPPFVRLYNEEYGFRIAPETAGEQNGWLVYVTEQKAKNDQHDYTVHCIRKSLSFDSSDRATCTIGETDGTVIGGLFVTLSYETIGYITISLSGIVSAVQNNTLTIMHYAL